MNRYALPDYRYKRTFRKTKDEMDGWHKRHKAIPHMGFTRAMRELGIIDDHGKYSVTDITRECERDIQLVCKILGIQPYILAREWFQPGQSIIMTDHNNEDHTLMISDTFHAHDLYQLQGNGCRYRKPQDPKP